LYLEKKNGDGIAQSLTVAKLQSNFVQKYTISNFMMGDQGKGNGGGIKSQRTGVRQRA
jgi:hypothetical protein